ncbi:hydroxymethylglutaryl-CoA lyase, partial [bacterium]|nr:hydroxymethylglutaryl-CoA lyase [bacterium]
MQLPSRVRIVEVGPRDGLQNEGRIVATADKVAFIRALGEAGLRDIEASSFVHPQVIPQLADAGEVFAELPSAGPVTYSALVPNQRGLERALAAGVKRIAVFTAASETFTRHNIRMSIDESLAVFAPVVERALATGLTVRGYLSTCFVCPYEGEVAKEAVRPLAERLLAMGCDEIAISDTIGAAGPRDVAATTAYLLETIPAARLALHFHDTYGTALANVLAGLELGISTFDASTAGLGGCPYAPGAAGNLATEDLVYMLERSGVET